MTKENRIKTLLAATTLIIFILIGSTFCYAGERNMDGPYYYRDIKDGTAPYEPVQEINYEEANNLYTYYEAYFDEGGRVVSMKKYSKGKLEWMDNYIYGPTGVLEDREFSIANNK